MSNTVYSYLENKELDIRFAKALEMIGSVRDKVILDLNCGTARILQYLPEGFTQYIGNDIDEECLEVARGWKGKGPISLIPCRDDEVIDYVTKLDVFMHFGINAGVNRGIESETELATFKKIIQKFLPKAVACEAWLEYEKTYKVISDRGEFLRAFGYEKVGSFRIEVVREGVLEVYKRG